MALKPLNIRNGRVLLPVFILTSSLLLAVSLSPVGASEVNQVGLTAVLIILIGMPHGGLDILMIGKLATLLGSNTSRHQSFARTLSISTVYVLVALGAGALWFVAPTSILILFLLIATVHFSNDWVAESHKPTAISLAVFTITASSVFHPQLLERYFISLLLQPQNAAATVFSMQVGFIASILMIASRTFLGRFYLGNFYWLGALSLAAYVLSPLWYFCAYFCAVHSVMHTIHVQQTSLLTWTNIAKIVTLPMLATCVLLWCFYTYLPTESTASRLLQVVFIGLFALTIPHIILTVIYDAYFAFKLSKSSKY